MPSVFLTSDTHIGHAGVCRFLRDDGVTKLRPWDNPEEMDEEMVKRWNETVKPNDKVYHLGDVVINRKALNLLYRLNGDKVLIRGNHDIFRDEEYREHFRELRAYHIMNGMILSHIPIHTESLGRLFSPYRVCLNKADNGKYLVTVEQQFDSGSTKVIQREIV